MDSKGKINYNKYSPGDIRPDNINLNIVYDPDQVFNWPVP